MSLLTLLAGDAPLRRDPTDDRWYQALKSQYGTDTGVVITPDGAQRVAAVYRAINLISNTLAMLPLFVYKRIGGGKDRVPDHPLYDILHTRPNGWQTSFDWRRWMQRMLLLRGNAYCLIVPGRRGAVDQLIPLHPDYMQVTQLAGSLRLVYVYTDPRTGAPTTYTQDQIFHLRGPSDDGIVGVGIIAYARQTLGLAIATESYGARLFSQGAMHGIVLSHPGRLQKQTGERIADSWQRAHSGLDNAHRPAVLEEGMKLEKTTMTADETQFILSRKFSVTEIARWFDVPPHKLYDLERSTNNNIEHQSLEFLSDSMLAHVVNWEQSIARDLILAPKVYLAEFLLDALQRADMLTRYTAYEKAIFSGWETRNEVRGLENMNPLPGLDTPLSPLNMRQGSDSPNQQQQPPAPSQDEPPPARPRKRTGPPTGASAIDVVALTRRAELVVAGAADRMVRREVRAIQTAAARLASDPAGWRVWATEFYGRHASALAETLALSLEDAAAYCAAQREELLAGNVAAAERWLETKPRILVALASTAAITV
jgi:HK97 family phage portal protein